MTVSTEGNVTHLQGDLTTSGVTQVSIDTLSVSLQQIASVGEKNIRIDCKEIDTADMSGLQLLYVWMQCARFQGMEPELVNLSDSLRQSIQRLGLGHCFTAKSAAPDPETTFTIPGSAQSAFVDCRH